MESILPARLDESVLERIVAETGGNPLALLELPRGLTPGQLAGGFDLPAVLPLSARIEESFRRRLARLPRDARRLLLLAAAEPVGDPALLWRAAHQLGIPETTTAAVESEGLLRLDGDVAFRHPLVRSAVYGAAEPNERRVVHRALADATDPQIDPDRRAWHRAQAASVRDEEVAAELEPIGGARAGARRLPQKQHHCRSSYVDRRMLIQPALSTSLPAEHEVDGSSFFLVMFFLALGLHRGADLIGRSTVRPAEFDPEDLEYACSNHPRRPHEASSHFLWHQ